MGLPLYLTISLEKCKTLPTTDDIIDLINALNDSSEKDKTDILTDFCTLCSQLSEHGEEETKHIRDILSNFDVVSKLCTVRSTALDNKNTISLVDTCLEQYYSLNTSHKFDYIGTLINIYFLHNNDSGAALKNIKEMLNDEKLPQSVGYTSFIAMAPYEIATSNDMNHLADVFYLLQTLIEKMASYFVTVDACFLEAIKRIDALKDLDNDAFMMCAAFCVRALTNPKRAKSSSELYASFEDKLETLAYEYFNSICRE